MTVAIIGVGTVGEVLLGGMLRAGREPEQIVAVARRASRAEEIRQRYGVVTQALESAVRGASTLLICVTPPDMGSLLDELAGQVSKQHLVVSVAAGVPTGFISDRLGARVPVVRAMPNTPALVDQAISAVSAGTYASPEHLDAAEELLLPVGRVLRVPEYQLDAVTALSGSGPAYFFYLVEAMIDAGILLGLPRTMAADLVVQTALGAATMLRDSGQHPVTLREAVTSPAGTTINAIVELEKHSVRAALIAAISAARDRSAEIAAGFAPQGR